MFKVLENGTEPTRGSKYSACVDLYASEDVTIGAGETVLVGLGVAIDLEDILNLANSFNDDGFMKSHYLQLMLRSSLGKKGLILPNGVGIIDLDYKDEIKMIIHNPMDMQTVYAKWNPSFVEINKGDRIAQVTLLEHKGYLFGIESEEERTGGFGSTDGCKVVL